MDSTQSDPEARIDHGIGMFGAICSIWRKGVFCSAKKWRKRQRVLASSAQRSHGGPYGIAPGRRFDAHHVTLTALRAVPQRFSGEQLVAVSVVERCVKNRDDRGLGRQLPGACETYAKKTGIIHTQCWTHCRCEFINAKKAEPVLAAEALDRIGALYAVEAEIRQNKLRGDAKRQYRLDHARPVAATFFSSVQRKFKE